MNSVVNFLENAIDIHVHVGPDYIPRYGDSVKLAAEASSHGMRAIVIKQHLASTVASAHLANEAVEGVTVFGGISLNEPTGAFNPRTVLATVKSGGKMIWLPTVDAEFAIKKAQSGHWIRHYVDGSAFGHERHGLNILTSTGKLKDEVREILSICKAYDVILGSGHIGPDECLALAEESKSVYNMAQTMNMVILAPLLFYFFPSWPQWIPKLFPTYWFIDPLYRIALRGAGLGQVWPDLAVALAVTALMLIPVTLLARRMEARLAR